MSVCCDAGELARDEPPPIGGVDVSVIVDNLLGWYTIAALRRADCGWGRAGAFNIAFPHALCPSVPLLFGIAELLDSHAKEAPAGSIGVGGEVVEAFICPNCASVPQPSAAG
jgi:hypothetical protein